MSRTQIMRASIVFFISLLIFIEVFPSRSAEQTFEEEFEKALSLYKKKDFAEALKNFQRLEQKYPASLSQPDLLFMQGQALRALQRWSEAARVFSRAAEVHPRLADYALYYQAEAFHMAGEVVGSLEVLKSLVTRHRESLMIPQAQLKMAELYLQGRENLRAVEICESLLRESPRKDYPAQALNFLAEAREGLEQWAEAIKSYQELWLRYPLHPLARKSKVRWELLAQEKKSPGERFTGEALFRRSLHFYQAHLYEAALGEIQQMEGFPPQAYPPQYSGERWIDELYFHRAMCLFRLKQYPKTAEAFNLVVQHSRSEEVAERSLFWMARALLRLGREAEALNAFALLQASYPRGAFIDQALYLKIRVFEDRGDLPQALALCREVAEKFPQSSWRFPALWQAGWLLFKNQDPSGAIQAWDRVLALNPNSPWKEKALYWKGRALERLGKSPEADENYQRLRRNYPASYYSLQAAARGRSWKVGQRNSLPLQDQPLAPFFELKEQSPGLKIVNLEKGKLLAGLGIFPNAAEELEAAEEEGRAMEEMRLEIARLYREIGEYHRSATLIRKNTSLRPLSGSLSEKERAFYLLAYPLGNLSWINQYAKARNLDPALLCAVILEESRFNPQALSPAGAKGLMQVLPGTGSQIAQRTKVHPYSEALLFDPEVNLRLGSWYLSSLLEEFKGKEVLALAAYNAGPHVVREWLARNSSGREDEFVENIPYAETRNYVIRVISSAQVYRMLYGSSKSPGKP